MASVGTFRSCRKTFRLFLHSFQPQIDAPIVRIQPQPRTSTRNKVLCENLPTRHGVGTCISSRQSLCPLSCTASLGPGFAHWPGPGRAHG